MNKLVITQGNQMQAVMTTVDRWMELEHQYDELLQRRAASS